MSWGAIAFFGSGMLVAGLRLLLRRSAGLTLDADGFEFRVWATNIRSRWQDVAHFKVVSQGPFRVKVAYSDLRQAGSKTAQVITAIVGYQAALEETYGLSAKDLAQLMAVWRLAAVSSRRPDAQSAITPRS